MYDVQSHIHASSGKYGFRIQAARKKKLTVLTYYFPSLPFSSLQIGIQFSRTRQRVKH
jgi:hypothetical protein